MRYIIDRFEGKYAICADDCNNRIEVEISRLPQGVREGTRVEIDDNSVAIISDDDQRVKRIADKMRDVWR